MTEDEYRETMVWKDLDLTEVNINKDLEFRAQTAELQLMQIKARNEELEKRINELKGLLIKSTYHLIIEDNPFS